MEKDRIIKPVSFNEQKDRDILDWIESVEKNQKLKYSQYVKQLILKDMQIAKQGNVQNIGDIQGMLAALIGNLNNAPIQQSIEMPIEKSAELPSPIKDINDDNNIISNISTNNIIDDDNNMSDDDMSNLNDILNGNF